MLRIRTPLVIAKCAIARDVVAQRAASVVGGDFEPRHLCGVHVDDHAMNLDDLSILRQRIFPGFELRRTNIRRHQIHIADVTLILLKSRHLFRIRRPANYRTVAVRPARIVRRIAKIFDAVGRQLVLFTTCDVFNPQVPVLNVDGSFAVR